MRIRAYYEATKIEGRLFEFSTVDGEPATDLLENASYLTSPVRGLLAVVVTLCGLAGAMYAKQDEKLGTFSWMPEKKRPLAELAGERPLRAVIVDPSAASFMEVLRRRGYRVQKAKNDVLVGIRLTAECLKKGKIAICWGCDDLLREMDCYAWDGSRERVKKEHDHAMDDMRYFVSTVLGRKSAAFAACTAERRR